MVLENEKPQRTSAEIMRIANTKGIAVPAFNIPYLPMMEPVTRAIVDMDAFSLVEVARVEWEKFESKSPQAVIEEFIKWHNPDHMRIHLDHIPVIDEDGERVDYLAIIQEAISLGYQSVMVDGSRLSLEENISSTREVVEMAHQSNVACEAELGSVMGHESGPLPPYEELFQSGKGFTDLDEARRFVLDTECDWLSVAIGNIHGRISKAKRDEKKVQARLDLDHLENLARITKVPLVLHGGSGIQQAFILESTRRGITKINIGTEIRQSYETALKSTGDVESAQQAVYDRTCWTIRDYLKLEGSQSELKGDGV